MTVLVLDASVAIKWFVPADDRLFNALAKAPEIAPHIQSLRDC